MLVGILNATDGHRYEAQVASLDWARRLNTSSSWCFWITTDFSNSTDFKPVFPPTSNCLIPNSAGSGKRRTFRAQVARYRYQCTVFSNCIPPKKSPNTPNISKRAWFQWKTRRCNSNAIFHLHRNGAAAARTEWLFHVIIAPNILRLSLIRIEIDTDQ